MTKSSRKSAILYFVLAALYYGVLTAVSHIPGKTISTIAPDIWDKALHFGAYLILGIFVAGGLSRLVGRERNSVLLALTASLILVLGAIDEYHQSFVPGRQMSAADALADVVGGAFGAFLVLYYSPLLAYLRRVTPRGS